MKPIKCHICNRGVIARTYLTAYNLAVQEGWSGGREVPSCPEHKRHNPIRNYWRYRDIREATNCEGELRNTPIFNWHTKRERVG